MMQLACFEGWSRFWAGMGSIIKFKYQSTMSDEEILPCVMCHQHHEQMLMLTCMHDPCINCAAVHYCSSQPSSSNVYACSECGDYTELDSSSTVELQRVYNVIKGKKKYDYRRNLGTIGGGSGPAVQTPSPYSNHTNTKHYPPKVADTYDNYPPSKQSKKVEPQPVEAYEPQPYHGAVSQPYTPVSQPSYPAAYNNISTRKAQHSTYMCESHPEEELSYFCFDCDVPICPECAIHGSHRQHQVQTTRKAIKTIKNNLHQKGDLVAHHSLQVGAVRDGYKNKVKEVGEESKRDIELVKSNFAHLRSILAEKEKEFQKMLESFADNNMNIVKGEVTDCEKTLEQHGHVKKNIDSTMRKDDLAILQDYSKREKEAQAAIDASKNKKFNENLEGMKQMDQAVFKDEMDQLSGIMNGLRLSAKTKSRNS